MAQNKNLSQNITKLRNTSAYKEFKAGYFRNVPDMKGYLYKFKTMDDLHLYLVVDTSNSAYSREYFTSKNYHFIIYKAKSLEAFIEGFYGIMSDLIDQINKILDKVQENKDILAGGIPHGYKQNDAGEIVVDPKEAIMVRKIYKLYTEYGSIRKIASELKSNFSHVRDVLHDYRYEKMKLPIIPSSVLKKARQKMDANRKNRTT